MKKPYTLSIELKIPILGESKEDVVNYVKKKSRDIANHDVLEYLRTVSDIDISEIKPIRIMHIVTVVDGDEYLYNSDEELTVLEWFQNTTNEFTPKDIAININAQELYF